MSLYNKIDERVINTEKIIKVNSNNDCKSIVHYNKEYFYIS
jgi:hypothetical protein